MTFLSRTTKQLLLLISFPPPYWLMGTFRNHLLKFLNDCEGQAGGNWGTVLREGRPAAPFSGEMQLTGGPHLGRKERVSLVSLAWGCRAGWL